MTKPNPFEKLLRSRRFWTAILGVVTVVLTEAFGASEELAETVRTLILMLLGGYIGADALAAYRSGEK